MTPLPGLSPLLRKPLTVCLPFLFNWTSTLGPGLCNWVPGGFLLVLCANQDRSLYRCRMGDGIVLRGPGRNLRCFEGWLFQCGSSQRVYSSETDLLQVWPRPQVGSSRPGPSQLRSVGLGPGSCGRRLGHPPPPHRLSHPLGPGPVYWHFPFPGDSRAQPGMTTKPGASSSGTPHPLDARTA